MNTLTALIRKRAEWISIVCGSVGGLVANIERSKAIVLWIVAASMFAGAIGNVSAEAGDDPGVRPRAGIRAGVLTAIIAGAVAVLGFTIQSPLGAFLVIVPALLAIPPGAFFGLVGSLVVSMIQNPQVRPLGPGEASRRNRPSILMVGIVLGSLTGYLSPFIALILPVLIPTPDPPPPPVVLATPTPTPKPTTTLSFVEKKEPPKPPPWKYEAPTDFADAHPSQLDVMKEVSLGAFQTPLRYAFARDGHTFAFLRSDSVITVLNLNEPETTQSFRVPETPKDFEFSPEGDRLFCLTANDGKFVVSKNSALRLPLPAGPLNGRLEWSEPMRVFIGDKALDLETLRLSNAPKDRVVSKRESHPNIRLRTGERLMSVDGSRIQKRRAFFLSDESRNYAVLAPTRGDSAFLSPDATKLIDVRDQQLVILYFKVRPSQEMSLTVDMGSEPPPTVAEALKSQRLFALLGRPIVNPINDKVVGADISTIRGVLGVRSWEGSKAQLWLKEDYGISPQDGDAATLLLNTQGSQMAAVSGFENWWSLVRDGGTREAPAIAVNASLQPISPEPVAAMSLPPIPEVRTKLPDRTVATIHAFIRDHHAKSSRGDVDGLVADYAERVDHLNGSLVNREAIRQDELKYHSASTRVSEVVAGEIVVAPVSERVIRATYTIRFEQIRPSGAWARGSSDIELYIEYDQSSQSPPRIVRQRAKSRDVQKGP